MAPIGIAISRGASASEVVDCVTLAESLGYESAWVAEGHGGDQFSILSACAATTTTIKLGTAISSVFVRSAPTIAMAAATVDDLSNGRFILGLGSSHKVQVVPEHGVIYEKPIQRLRETVDVVRTLLAEGVVSYEGETIRIENFDFWFKPHRPKIPIYVAGLFPKMTAVCGEIADGIILTRSTVKTATEIRRNLSKGAARVGRDPANIKLTSLLPTAVADTRAEAMDMMRPGLAFYVGFFPRYNKLIASHGFEEEAAAVGEAFAKGDMEGANRAVTDAMIDATSVAGTPEQCRERIAAYRDSGIELPIISLFMRGGDAKVRFETAIRACAGA
jgi:alkanesulfonate monooxygenase SsuD/methylene tetrahydromethanopterin reductase-like flavin-dependent oxidoreductase (luciferase family)